MSNQFLKLRRSAVPGKIPDTGSLDLGEIALNTHDGLTFMKKSVGGSESIVIIGNPTGSFTGSFSGEFTGSLLGSASWAYNAVTASTADNFYVRGNITGSNAIFSGTVTAQRLVVQTISSSVIYSSGSNIFGDELTDTQQFTGSVTITGSLSLNNDPVVTLIPYNTFSSSIQLRATKLESTASILTAASASLAIDSGSNSIRLTNLEVTSSAVSASYASASGSLSTRVNNLETTASVLTTASASFAVVSASYSDASQSLSIRTTNLEITSSIVSASYASASGSLSTRVTNLESTASVLTTASASFAVVSGSYASASGSLSTRTTNLESTASVLTLASASFSIVSASYASASGSLSTRVTTLENASASFAQDSGSNSIRLTNLESTASVLTQASASFSSSIAYLSSSFIAFSQSYNTGSFTGSFNGQATLTGSFTGKFYGDLSGSFSGSVANVHGATNYIARFDTPNSVDSSVIYQSASHIAINETSFTSGNPEALYVFQTNPTSINVITGKGNTNNYLQLNIQNTNQGIQASSDIVATANNGNENSNYIDMGINSENFNIGFIGGANDAYVYSIANNLHIGNAATNGSHLGLFVGGTDVEANNKLQLNAISKHIMSGSLDITGSLFVQKGITGSLFGTASWAMSASYVQNAQSASYVLQAVSASYALSASSAVQANTASYVLQAVSASFASNASTASYVLNAVSASYAATASSADDFFVRQNITASNALIYGSLTAQTIYAQYITASTELITGSTKFGTQLTNTHQFTGSVTITGSLSLNNDPVVTQIPYNNFSQSIQSRATKLESTASVLTSASASFAQDSGSNSIRLTNLESTASVLTIASASFALVSGSYVIASQSLSTRTTNLESTASILTTASASFAVVSGSYSSASSSLSTRTTNLESTASILTTASASFALVSGSYSSASSSLSTRVTTLENASASFAQQSGSNSIRLTNLESTASVLTTASASFAVVSSSFAATSASLSTRATNLESTASVLTTASASFAVLSSSFAATSGSLSTRTTNLELTASVLTTASASFAVVSGSYSSASGSLSIRVTTLEQASASFAQQSGSNSIRLTNLESTASILTTASASFSLVSASYSAFSQSYNTGSFTGSFTGRGNLTGSLFGTASWASNAVTSSYILQAVSASFATTASYVISSSYANNADLLDGKDSSTFATTGSNVFIGNQTVTGSLFTSGSNTLVGSTTLTGSFNVTGSTVQTGNNTLIGNTTLSGSIIISGSTGPGAATASVQIFGDIKQTGYHRFDPVNANIDTTVSASYIYVSGSTQDLYFSQNSKGYNNVTRLRWLEGNLYTGLLHGGLITTQSSTVYRISSGSGIIVNLNASLSDDPYPAIKYLNWSNLSASIAPLTASYQQAFVSIDSTGNIYQQGTPYAAGQFDTEISIGVVLFQNQSTINGVKTQPSLAYGFEQQQNIFNRAFGPLKLSGYTLAPSGSSTGSLIVASGTAYSPGSNYPIDPNNPSYATDSGTNVSKIFRYRQSGSTWVYDTNAGLGYGAIDPTQYSNNGVLTAVPGGGSNREFSIQRVFYFPNSVAKAIVVYYGNATYTSLVDATANIAFESFVEAPNTAANAIYLGAIIVRNNADFTDTDSYAIQAGGLFRSVGGSGGGGSVITQTLSGLSDVSISGPTNGQPLVYKSTSGKWENSSTLTANLTGNASTATTASFAVTASYVLQAVSSSFATTASYVQNAQSASYVLNAVSASYAATASSADNFLVRQNITASNALIIGTLTAQTIIAQTITSSTDFVTGSTKFGTLLTNTHQFTGSVTVTGSLSLNDSPVVTNATFTPFSSSVSTRLVTLENASSSFAFDSGSNSNRLTRLETTASVLTTASASFALVSASYASASGSLSTRVTTLENASASFAQQSGSNSIRLTNLETTASVLTTASASFALVSASYSALSGSFRTGSFTGSFFGSLIGTASWASNAVTSSYILQAVSASFAATASSADNFLVRQSITASNALITGTLTAQTIIAQTITSSTDFVTGSTKFGSLLSNTHQFTGSVSITGSLTLPYLSTGSVLFAGATDNITEDNTNLFWDNTNKRLGIGNNNPLLLNEIRSATNNAIPSLSSATLDGAGLGIGNAGTNAFAIFGQNNSGQFYIQTRSRLANGTSFQLLLNPLGGNVAIGDTADGGQRLQVYGDAFIKGSGATSATNALLVQNSAGTQLLKIQNDGTGNIPYIFYVGHNSTNPFLFSFDGNSSSSANASGRNLAYYNTNTTQTGDQTHFALVGNSLTPTSGDTRLLLIERSFAPTSGTAIFTAQRIVPTINQTGGANGITRGLYVNPTLTAAADWRSIEWSNNSGYGLYGAGTANNYLAGNLGIGTTSPSYNLDVNGSARVTGNLRFDEQLRDNRDNGVILQSLSSVITNRILTIGNATYLNINFPNGNILVGTTADNGQRLQVSGSTLLNGNTTITGSLTVITGSAVEFQVTNIGVAIGNAITDIHTVTGSLSISGSLNAPIITGSLFGTASWAQNATTASYVLNAVSASFAATASSADNFLIRQNATASNLLVNNTITAQTLVVQTVTSSIVFSSGSNIFGNQLTNVQQFTGSLRVTGSGNHYIMGGSFGVGTTSPTDRLQVVASTYNGITITTPDVTTLKMTSTGGTKNWGFATTNLAVSDFGIYESNLGGGDPINAGTARLYFRTGGNTGINTTSPSYKLDVAGDANITANLTATGSIRFPSLSSANQTNIVGYNTATGQLFYQTTSSLSVASASYAATSSYATNFTIQDTLNFAGTLTDYASVASSIVGSNNLFTQATASYTSAFFKYTVSNSTNARTGEMLAVWNGTSVQFTDNSTLDIGSTTPVTCSVSVVSGDVQFNVQTNTSGWRIKSIGTFM